MTFLQIKRNKICWLQMSLFLRAPQGHIATSKSAWSLCAHSRTSSHFTSSIIDSLLWWGKAHCACLADWLAGWLGVWGADMWLLCFPSALRCRRGPRQETAGQEPAVGTGHCSVSTIAPFVVIDWTCLMCWDQLSGHICACPTPQTLETDENVYTRGWRWFWCHGGI